jgi:hypothetical protein
MTDAEKDGWDSMVDALRLCAVALPVGDGVLTAVKAALKLAEKAMSGEELDQYGNPMGGDRIINCCFPGCGCDGARLCMAENGASSGSLTLNRNRRALA